MSVLSEYLVVVGFPTLETIDEMAASGSPLPTGCGAYKLTTPQHADYANPANRMP
jgi:hypothetical protein